MEKAKSPKEVFSAFNDIPKEKETEGEGTKLLRYIAESRNIEASDLSRKKLISELTRSVVSAGLSVMLKVLKLKILKRLAKKCDWGDNKLPSGKATIAKKIHDTMEEVSPKKFLEKCDSKLLEKMLDGLDVTIPSKSSDYVKAIIDTAKAMGLENCFSSFPPSKLKEFIRACGLFVDSDSIDNLLECLVEQESKIAPYELAAGESPSKEKPEIDKDISVVDLFVHYYREELAEYLKKNELISSGSKKELVDRIRRFLDDKIEEKSKEWRHPKPKKEKKTTETTQDQQSESDKSTPTKKSSKRNRTSSSENERKKSKGRRSKSTDSDDESQDKEKGRKRENKRSDKSEKPNSILNES
jgi:hypothetical protein